MNRHEDVAACVCGHTAYWHSHGGAGDCEHDGQCKCQKFDPESVSVEVATEVEALGGSGSDRSAATTPWWKLRPEFFRTEETPSAMRTVRYGFGLVKSDHTRRFLATLDRIDYDAQGHRSRGFIFDVRLFG